MPDDKLDRALEAARKDRVLGAIIGAKESGAVLGHFR